MHRNRFKILLMAITAGVGVLVGRLAHLQLLNHDAYLQDAYGRRVRMEVTGGPRGAICDRNGIVLAEDRPAYDITVVPGRLCARSREEEAAALAVLARAMRRTPGEVRERIYGEGGVRDCLAGNLARHLRWLARREMLRMSEEETREFADIVRSCDSLARARADIEGRFGKKALAIFDQLAADPCVLESGVTPDVRDSVIIEAGGIRGVSVASSSVRCYPCNDTACHVIGYLGHLPRAEYERREEEGRFSRGLIDIIGQGRYGALERSNYFAGQLFGRAGIESALDEEMRPSPGARLVVITREGEETLGERESRPGGDVTLTIDIRLQRAAEEALGGQKGAAVVMDVRTGEILALASSPRYDLNTFRRRENYALLESDLDAPLVHRAATGLYAPGSTFKIIEAVAAMHEIEGFESVTYDCPHQIRLGPNTLFSCNNHSSTDPMDLREALKKSCNIFFYRTASRLGGEKVTQWAGRFGLGRRTGIEIGDAQGNVAQPRGEGQIANMSIGQGPLLVTPLQMARAAAAIANGGRLVTPRLVLRPARDSEAVDLGLSEERLEVVRRGMWAVVNETGGTAYKTVRMERVEVAGKTGTAEIGGTDLNNAWFVGYAPYDKPEICIAVVIEKTAGHGGDIAGPVAKKVLQAYFHEEEQGMKP